MNDTKCWNIMIRMRTRYMCSNELSAEATIEWILNVRRLLCYKTFWKLRTLKWLIRKLGSVISLTTLIYILSHSYKDTVNIYPSHYFFIFLLLSSGSIAIIWCKRQRASPNFYYYFILNNIFIQLGFSVQSWSWLRENSEFCANANSRFKLTIKQWKSICSIKMITGESFVSEKYTFL